MNLIEQPGIPERSGFHQLHPRKPGLRHHDLDHGIYPLMITGHGIQLFAMQSCLPAPPEEVGLSCTEFPKWGILLTFPFWEYYIALMRVIATKTINAYRKCYPEAEEQLKSWVAIMEQMEFKHFPDLKSMFPTVDLISADRIVFNIKGNKFRLIAGVDFSRQIVCVKWFGRHRDYDNINPSEVKHEYPPC